MRGPANGCPVVVRVCAGLWALVAFCILTLYLLSSLGGHPLYVVIDGVEHTFQIGPKERR